MIILSPKNTGEAKIPQKRKGRRIEKIQILLEKTKNEEPPTASRFFDGGEELMKRRILFIVSLRRL